MISEKNKIENECIYNEDKSHRYLLSRVWDKEKPIAMFFTKNSGQADGVYIELTNNIITNNLYRLGYGGYYAVNLYSAVDNASDNLFDKDTDNIIKKYAKISSEIIIAWGSLTTNKLKERELAVIDILNKSGKKLLTVCDASGHKNVHPLTPSVRQSFLLADWSNDLS